MIIKQIELLNFQVIKEFNASFEGNVYFITGDNELGKSTLLKAIGILLTGERDNVLKNGEEKGFAKMVIGDDGENYEVELRFTEKNPRGTLSIKAQSTGMKSDNVSMLQKVFGYQDFDAVEFSRWSETAEGRRKQVEVVKSLLPENVQKRIAEIDADIAKTRDARKDDNASLKTYAAIVSSAQKELSPGDLETYKAPVEIDDLMSQQKTEAQLIEKAKGVRERLAARVQQIAEIPNKLEALKNTHEQNLKSIDEQEANAQTEYDRVIKEAKERLKSEKEKAEQSRKNVNEAFKNSANDIAAEQTDLELKKTNAENWLKEYEKQNPEGDDVAAKIQKAADHNKKAAKVAEYREKLDAKKAVEKKVSNHEAKLTKLANEREKLIKESKLPIDGLTFTDDGLELGGVPFVAGKVSDSQIMEVAAKLIISSNPTVKVFRIARGESLGENRLKSLIELAKKNKYQGFIEQVVRGQNDMIVEEYKEKK